MPCIIESAACSALNCRSSQYSRLFLIVKMCIKSDDKTWTTNNGEMCNEIEASTLNGKATTPKMQAKQQSLSLGYIAYRISYKHTYIA